MIEVEIRRAAALGGYDRIATLAVADDGTWTTTGDILTPDYAIPHKHDGMARRYTLQDDPAAIARLLPRRMNSGYLTAVITHDTGRPATPGIESRRLITRAEAAERAGVTPDTWSAYVTRAQAPAPAQHVGRTPQWSLADVERWMAARPRVAGRRQDPPKNTGQQRS